MDLKQSLTLVNLQKDDEPAAIEKRITAEELARRVFRIAAEAGEPYVGLTSKQWAKKWLASSEFVLTQIEASSVAAPRRRELNQNKVLSNVKASAVQPIVVDLNKRGIGSTSIGFVPEVIVVDGAHRQASQQIRGKEMIEAWVGVKAINKVLASLTVHASNGNGKRKPRLSTRMEAAMVNAPAPMTTNKTPVPAQDVAQRSSAPNSPMPGLKNTGTTMKPFTKGMEPKIYSTGGGSGASGGTGGATGGPGGTNSGMNPNNIYSRVKASDPSDKLEPGDLPDPSDREDTDVDPSDRDATGTNRKPAAGTYSSPSQQSPGSGVGPRTKPSKGASNSELSKTMKGDGKVIPTMYEKKKRMAAVAPPGREQQVLKLKEKFGEDSAVPFKIAWSQKNRKK